MLMHYLHDHPVQSDWLDEKHLFFLGTLRYSFIDLTYFLDADLVSGCLRHLLFPGAVNIALGGGVKGELYPSWENKRTQNSSKSCHWVYH